MSLLSVPHRQLGVALSPRDAALHWPLGFKPRLPICEHCIQGAAWLFCTLLCSPARWELITKQAVISLNEPRLDHFERRLTFSHTVTQKGQKKKKDQRPSLTNSSRSKNKPHMGQWQNDATFDKTHAAALCGGMVTSRRRKCWICMRD